MTIIRSALLASRLFLASVALLSAVSLPLRADHAIEGMPAGLIQIDDDETVQPFSNVTLTDPDTSTPVTVTVVISAASEGTFTNLGGFSLLSAGNYRFVGSAANATAALRGLVFVPTKNRLAPGSTDNTQLTVTLAEDDHSTSDSVTIRVTSVNDTPSIGLPGTHPTMGDDETRSIFSGVSLSDPDLNEQLDITVDYDPDKGSFTAASRSSSGFVIVSDGRIQYTSSGSATVGTAQTALRTLVFEPKSNQVFPGDSETLAFGIEVEDKAGASASKVLNVTVQSINDAPVLTNPGQMSLNATAGASIFPFSQVTLADADVEAAGAGEEQGDDFTASIELSGGPNPGTIASTSFTSGGGNTYTFTGKRGQVEAAIQTLTYLAPSATATFTLTLTVEDVHGAESSPAVIVTVAVTQPTPGITGLAAGQQVADTGTIQPFASATFNSFGSVSRVVEIAFDDDEKGSFDILGSFTAVDGPDGIVYRMTGSAVAATNAIRTLRYRPVPNRIVGESEVVTFTITVSEQGSGTLLTSDSLAVTVIPVNDAPTISSDSPEHRINDDETVKPFTTTSVSDPDENGSALVTVTITMIGQDPDTQLPRPGGGDLLREDGDDPYSFSGSPAEVTAILQGLTFRPTPNRNREGDRETVTFTVRVEDEQGAAAQNAGITVIVLSVNGAPVISGIPPLSQQPFPVAGSADAAGIVTSTPFRGLTVTDDETVTGPDTLTFTITLDNPDKGTLNGSGFSSSDGGTTYTMTGTPDEITAALQNLVYELNPGYSFPLDAPGQTTFTLKATDSPPALNVTTTTFAIVIRERSVAHIVTVASDNDPGTPVIPGSLREAIDLAENNDMIVFDFADNDYPVTIRLRAPLAIERNVTLIGSGVRELAISGDSDGDGIGDVPLFRVQNGAQFAIEQVTLRDGFAPSYGGAISSESGTRIVVRYCSFENNRSGQFGGAIDVFQGELQVEGCLFLNNAVSGSTAQAGGAISVYTTVDSLIRNSTFAHNFQEGPGGFGGGAVYAENGDLASTFNLRIEHCTFADNSDAAASGSAILSSAAGLNTYVLNNIFADQEGLVLDVLGGGQFISLGGNIATDATTTTYIQGGQPQNVTLLNHATDRTSTDPGLLELADNGGATRTFGLDSNSPARNNAVPAVSPAEATAIDQRGVWRDASPDIGALEADRYQRVNINEIYADVITGEKPFIEFYNPRDSSTLNMENLILRVDGADLHTFGDVELTTGSGFAWESPTALDAERGTISLVNQEGQELLRVHYVTAFSESGIDVGGTQGQSINRYPLYEGGFLPHQRVVERVTGIAGGVSTSPGDDVNGAPLGGGNAPPIAMPDDAVFAVSADEIVNLEVLLNDIEFDRTDELRITEMMIVSGGAVVNQELLSIDGSGQIVLADLPAGVHSTVDPAGVNVAIDENGRSLIYDPTSSPVMTGLAAGETAVDLIAYTILDFDEAGSPHSRGSDDTRRSLNIERATAYATILVTGVNNAPVPGNDHFATTENQAVRLLADSDLLAPASFDFGDEPDAFMDFDAEGKPVSLPPAAPAVALLTNDNDVDSDDTNKTLLLVAVHTTDVPADLLETTSEKGASVRLDIRANRRETHIVYDPRGSEILNRLSHGEVTEDSFYYSVIDRHGARGVGKVTVTVTGVNDVPTAMDDDGFIATEDGALAIPGASLLANDVDPDQNGSIADDAPVIVQPFASTSDLGAKLAFDGTTIIYDPTGIPGFESLARNESIVDTFTYRIDDGNGGTDEATVILTVEGRNDRPVAGDDLLRIAENDTVVTGTLDGLLANDYDVDINGSDPDDDPWIIPQRNVTTPLGAALNIEVDGSYRYDANSPAIDSLVEGEVAVEVFPYTLIDNSRTTAANDIFRVQGNREDIPLDVLVNDVVAGSKPIAIGRYLPDPSDPNALIIESPNHALRDGLLVKIEGYQGEGQYDGTYPITVLGRDRFGIAAPYVDDPEGSRGTWRPWFAITRVGDADQGGTLSNPDGQILLYTPTPGFYGEETFTYTIEDGAGGQDVASVSVEVVLPPLNGFISASPDRFRIGMGVESVDVDVLANDSVLPAPGHELIITETAARNGAVGVLSIIQDGAALRYTPPGPTFIGEESFSYTVSGGGSVSAEAVVTFEVVDRTERLSGNDDYFFVVTGSANNLLDVLANDAHLPEYPVVPALAAVDASGSSGSAEIAGNQVSYTPPPSPYLGTDTFTYTARDASGATVMRNVNVQVVPDAANFFAQADQFTIAADAGSVLLPVLLNDGAVKNEATLTIVNLGLDTNAPPDPSRVAIIGGGTFIEYTPPPGAAVEDFTYEISDGTVERREAKVTITVVDSFEVEPQPEDDFFHVERDAEPVALDVLLNDLPHPDAGWTWTITSTTNPNHGGSIEIIDGTTLFYTPASGFFGTETFEYTIQDAFGDSGTAAVTVQVGVLMTAPDRFTVLENSANNPLPVLTNDDVVGGFSSDYTIVSTGTPAMGGAVVIDGAGPGNRLLYTPAAGFSGEDTFNYTVSDRTGGTRDAEVVVFVVAEDSDRDVARLRVEITGVNDLPILSGLSDATISDKETIHPFAAVTLTDLDESGAQEQTVVVTFDERFGLATAPQLTRLSAGRFQFIGTPAEATAALRSFVFTPHENVIDYVDPGAEDVVFTIRVDDGYVASPVSEEVTVTIIPVNDGPVVTSSIPDQIVPVNSPPVGVFLRERFGDVDDREREATWTITSNTNPGLFTSVSIESDKQLVVLSFATNETGVAEITIRETDRGGLFAETTFRVIVEGPPVIDLPAGETQPPGVTFVQGSQNGFRRDYRHSFRVVNEGIVTAEAFIVHVSGLENPIDGIVVHAGSHSTNENGTPDNFADDTTTAEGVSIVQKSTYAFALKFDVPLAAGESTVVHVTYRASSLNLLSFRPTIEIELTTATPAPGATMTLQPSPLGGGEFVFAFPAEAGRIYQAEYSDDLNSWDAWTAPIAAGFFSRMIVITDDGLNTAFHPFLSLGRFYRATDITVE